MKKTKRRFNFVRISLFLLFTCVNEYVSLYIYPDLYSSNPTLLEYMIKGCITGIPLIVLFVFLDKKINKLVDNIRTREY